MIAPAKLNLFLHVAPPRQDGLHELFSLVAFAELGDQVHVAEAAELALSIEGPFANELDVADDTNSLRLAARALQEWCAENGKAVRGASISLVKNLPVASGIGGGSSDAAATLLGLVEHWRLDLPKQDLEAIALKLGADVPVCLYRKPAWMTGIGEIVAAGPKIPELPVVLVNPLAPVSTGEVYSKFDALASEGSGLIERKLPQSLDTPSSFFDYLGQHNNDLEAAAISIEPAVALVLEELNRSGASFARMSGSGATCFGLYERPGSAEQAAIKIAKDHSKWWVKQTALMN